MWTMHDGAGWWWLMGIGWIIVIGLVIWGVVALTRRGGKEPTSGESSPIDIVKRRYAKGEISKEQYEEIKRNL